jgi:acyl-CoA hydrolase
VTLTTSVGATPTFLHAAGRVVIELNRHHPPRLAGLHDIPATPARLHRPAALPDHPLQRIGKPYAVVDPAKVVGVVATDEPDEVPPFDPPNDASRAIAGHLARFLAEERAAGRLPPDLLPIQLGVGNVANAVLDALGAAAELPPFWMYSEVLQESQVGLLRSGRLRGASASALTLTPAVLASVYADWEFFAPRLVLRPQEITNDPGAIRHLGLIALNTALEVDVYGHANSTHVCGTQLMNGVGGSGDFVRNAYLSVMMSPSTAKGGRVSTVVPMCSHVDQNEHSVQVIVTEQGLADLRGKGSAERARLVIDRCAHPAYRDYLHRYLDGCPAGHLRHDLARCFELHRNLMERGSMRELSGQGGT